MIFINTLNRPERFLRSSSYIVRHFSIMEYYRSVRPVPQPAEKFISVPKPKEVSAPEISHKIKRSTRPYVGPQIETRQPVPLEVNVNAEKNLQASTLSWIAPKQPTSPKFLKVALLGLPNSGKSSFLNTLLNSTVSAVSPKVNTTREDIKGVLTVDDTQVVVIDSPGRRKGRKVALGIIASHKRRKFCKGLVKIAWRGLEEADVCLFIVDVVKRPKSDLYNILRMLSGKTPMETYSESMARDGSEECDVQEDESIDSETQRRETKVGLGEMDEDAYESYSAQSEFTDGDNVESDDAEDEGSVKRKVPVALILNKIDLASHRKWVKSRVRELKVHGNFCDIFYISAKHGIGFLPVINFLKRVARPGPWIYPPDMVTTLSKVKIVEQLVRTYIFCWFNKDVPYKVEQNIIGWTYAENGSLNIEMELYVRAVKVAKMICGVEGRLLKQLQKNVSSKLSRMWNELVFVFIHIKVK